MSEMSQAMTRQRITYMSDDSAVRKLLRAAFKAGREEREVLMNKRASAIELAATLAERKRCHANGHPITQNGLDLIVGALRELVETYEAMPDGALGCGLTNGPFLRGRKALNYFDNIDD